MDTLDLKAQICHCCFQLSIIVIILQIHTYGDKTFQQRESFFFEAEIKECLTNSFLKRFLVKKTFFDQDQLFDQVKKLIQVFSEKTFKRTFWVQKTNSMSFLEEFFEELVFCLTTLSKTATFTKYLNQLFHLVNLVKKILFHQKALQKIICQTQPLYLYFM